MPYPGNQNGVALVTAASASSRPSLSPLLDRAEALERARIGDILGPARCAFIGDEVVETDGSALDAVGERRGHAVSNATPSICEGYRSDAVVRPS